jgi:hypothetical protein
MQAFLGFMSRRMTACTYPCPISHAKSFDGALYMLAMPVRFCFNNIGENAKIIVSLRWESKLLDARHQAICFPIFAQLIFLQALEMTLAGPADLD